MRITHVVCSNNFAGVERHVAVLAAAQHDRGHEVTVLGGNVARMRAAINRPGVPVLAAAGITAGLRLLNGAPGRRADIVASHMTAADLAAAVSPALLGTPIVSTRHFAADRGSTILATVAAAALSHRISADVAVSQFVADSISSASVVILPGITDRPDTPCAQGRERVVLLVQRLDRAKATDVGLKAFAHSGLADRGWRLHVAGDGTQRPELERLADELGIGDATTFLGQRRDVDALMAEAGLFLATTEVEAMGLSVLEAMANGLPVVASAAGGHLESVGPTPGAALFPPGDSVAAAQLLADLAADPLRRDRYGAALRERQRTAFAVSAQTEATDALYRYLLASRSSRPTERARPGRDLVVISLEPWDEVWRRNQHLVAGLLRRDPDLRVLFVEPGTDPLHAARTGAPLHTGRGLRRGPHLTGVAPDALWLYEPTKIFPRRVDPHQDARWAKGVERAARRSRLSDPLLWVNDPRGVEVLEHTGWPALYDITDDWLAADRDRATHERLVRQEERLMRQVREVVVCSPALQHTKSTIRPVTLLRNAVDVDAVRTPVTRPADLPPGPVAVYVGTLHGDRLDVDLCVETAHALAGTASLVLVGPNALTASQDAKLQAAGIIRLGARDSRVVPGYLQHADVLLVPHLVDDFTDSLDPIKLYEYRAVGRPVVSTPVSGFREAADDLVTVIPRHDFAHIVLEVARDLRPTTPARDVPRWAERVTEMGRVLNRISQRPDPGLPTAPEGPGAVPLDVRVQLGHAAVQWLADTHGVDLLHIKGHGLHPSLLHPGRHPSDIDVLVRPDHLGTFLKACRGAGFTPRGRFATSSAFEHSMTLVHDEFGYVDVHRLYPGIGLTPQQAFERLWSTRGHTTIAGHECPVPEIAAQVAILVLHAGRNITGGQATRDVQHTWHAADEASRAAVRAVVDDLDAEVAFAAGIGELDSLPPSPERDLWQAVTRPSRRVEEWRARIAAAPGPMARARLIARMPLVNTDHLATQLGRRPSRREVASAFIDRLQRAVHELTSRGGRR